MPTQYKGEVKENGSFEYTRQQQCCQYVYASARKPLLTGLYQEAPTELICTGVNFAACTCTGVNFTAKGRPAFARERVPSALSTRHPKSKTGNHASMCTMSLLEHKLLQDYTTQ